jgi:CBS-domain-containing membrane protein
MMTVRDVMTKAVVSVRPNTPLRDVAQLLLEGRISGLPVVDDSGAVVGVVSEADFLFKEQGPPTVEHPRLARLLGESRDTRTRRAKLGALNAGEAMTSPAITVSSSTRITDAAAIMSTRGVNRLPVVDDGRLVGIVSRADLVRAYVRSDEELTRSIQEDVLVRILWMDPAMFRLSVRDGVVSISGHVERRSTADMVERAVAMVPGILDVTADITWTVDDSRPEGDIVEAVFPLSLH